MPRLTGALLILIATTTGCTQPGGKPESPGRATASAPLNPLRTVASTAPTTTTTTSPVTTTATEPLPTNPISTTMRSPEDSARQLIQRLIDRQPGLISFDNYLWSAALEGGSIVQVTTLNEAGGRAEIAVSVAFETTGDSNAEPLGLRVQLHSGFAKWVVDGIGYL